MNLINQKSTSVLSLIDLIKLNKSEKKAFLIIFSVSFLSLLSIIQANILYMDDIYRVTSGAADWDDNGRPLADLVIIILNLGKPLTDISPLPQILSLMLYSISAVYLGKVFAVKNLVLFSLSGIIFVLNPFNLANFCFIFDSLTMGFAVLTSTAAFFVTTLGIEQKRSRPQKVFIFSLGLLFLLSSLCFYQAATSIYIGALSLYVLLNLIKRESLKIIIKMFVIYLGILLMSLVAYIPIKNYYVKGFYSLQQSKTISMKNFPEKFIINLSFSIQSIAESLGKRCLVLLLLLFLIFIITIISIIFKRFLLNQEIYSTKKIIIIILTLFSLFLLIFSFSGLILILENPIFSERTFMGFGAAVGMTCFCLSFIFYPYKFLRYFLVILLSILFIAFTNVSLTLGNVLYTQNIQEQIVASVLISDLDDVMAKVSHLSDKPRIVVAGELRYSSLNSVAFNKYPILKKITRFYFRKKALFGLQKFKSLEIRWPIEFPYSFEFIENGKSEFTPSSPPIISRQLYDLFYEKNNLVVIQFK